MEETLCVENNVSKKEKRAQKKQKKLVAEYVLSVSNDEMKRPGELLDSTESKKMRIDPGDRKKLPPEEFKALKKLLAERKKILTQLPKFILQGAGSSSSMSVDHDSRQPIFMRDVQHLLLYALGGNSMIHNPSWWCNLQKATRLTHILALVLEGLSSRDFSCYEHIFPKLTTHFQDRVEVVAPVYYGRDIVQELSCIPLSNVEKNAILKESGSLEKAFSQKEVVKQFRALFPVEESSEVISMAQFPSVTDVFSRTYLLMGFDQLIFEGYPMPFWAKLAHNTCSDYKMSKTKYKEVGPHSPMFSIDCEMCITTFNPSELTRIAVVNENLEVVYETYVKPKNKITNYLTQFSGITEEKLKDVTTTLEDVQEALMRLLPDDAILIGQSLNFDLHALKMMHPYIIDTSVIYNLSGIAGKKSKLSHLAEVFLKEEIQSSKDGHCPVEDATTAMKLVKLKLSKGFLFGDNHASTTDFAMPGNGPIMSTSIFNRAYKSKKSVAVVGRGSVLKKYENAAVIPTEGNPFTALKTSKNHEAIDKLIEVGTSHQLTIAHIDLSKKIKKKEREEKELLLQKVDSWCDKVYNHVSVNGMCVVIFSGPKYLEYIPEQQAIVSDDYMNRIEIPKPSDPSDITPLPTPNQPEVKVKKKRPRQNGVCFIRINTKKV